MNPAEQAARFCSVLFAGLTGLSADVYTHVWSSHNQLTRWLSAHQPAATAEAVRAADSARGAAGTYIGMGLTATAGLPNRAGRRQRPERQRPLNDEVCGIVCVWVDIDLAGPAHGKAGLPPTRDEALRILAAIGLAPTMVWSTGHGIQAVWCLAEALLFTPGTPEAAAAARLVRDWNLTLAMHAHRLGRYVIDSTHDLARVLRAPGSTNRKIEGDHRPVELIEVDENARYDVDDLLGHTADPHYLARFGSATARTDGKGAASVDLPAVWAMVNSAEYRERRHEPEWLTGMVDAEVLSERDTLVKVFRSGHESGDLSSRDASLVRCLADMRDPESGGHLFDERDAVELVMCAGLRDRDPERAGRKLDPARRTSYVIITVDKFWGESDRALAAKAALVEDAGAALAAQEAAARSPAPLPVLTEPSTSPHEPAHVLREMGGAMVRDLADVSAAVVPDDDADVDDGDDLDVDGDDESSWDERADDPDQVHDDPHDPTQPQVNPPPSAPHTAAAGAPADVEGLSADVERPSADVPAPDARPATDGGVLRPMPSPWGTRTESQHRELTSLSVSLLGPYAEWVQIWRLHYRGKGAKQERRVLLRIAEAFNGWLGQPPEGYVPGQLLASGWYPAGAFNTLGGWIRALRQDCLIVTEPMTNEQFNLRFSDTLVRMWEPDTSGGSLANTTREAITSYLLDYAPTPEWVEATAQGTPFIVQSAPRWSLDARFTVLVRWTSLARHVRAHFAVNVTPSIAAEMAELSGSRLVPTVTQDGQWRAIRREYLGDAAWAAILHGGALAETRREDRHGMRVVGELPAERHVDGLGGPHRSAPGSGQ